MKGTIAICGISGVGKSHFANAVSDAVGVKSTSASVLLQVGRALEAEADVPHDSLGNLPLDRNQFHIESGYISLRTTYSDLLLLDCHVVIDTATGLEKVPPYIFSVLDLSAFVFLKADPEIIFSRRSGDTGRQRPYRTVAQLSEAQEMAQEVARAIALELAIPFYVIDVGMGVDDPAVQLESLGVLQFSSRASQER